ncbi:MAG: FAD-dependent oxidoreductase, partial [Candidatus Eremiobacteraeota bacterium]|nr:FAD-dependent oxidoreductase [Candidatus Eremiobacteraeota bacterium]
FTERAEILSRHGRVFELLNRNETVALEPALTATARGGLFVHCEGQVDNRRLGRALLAACERNGVDVLSNCTVHAIQTDTRRVLGLRTSAGFVAAGVVVNATGAWSAQLGGVPPACAAAVFPVKGQMLSLEIPKGFMRHVTWCGATYFVPRSDGRLLVGATVENEGFDARPNAQGAAKLLNAALKAAPALRNFTISETWAGLRPATPDARPFIGQTALGGYYLAAGHYRNGILLAPSTGALLADVLEGKENAFAGAVGPTRAMPEPVS